MGNIDGNGVYEQTRTNGSTTLVSADILRRLFEAGPLEQGAYYGAQCGCEERAKNAGTTLKGLLSWGLVLQCEHHNAYMGKTRVPVAVAHLDGSDPLRVQDLEARRASYKAAHLGFGIDSRVTSTTAPSGIRLARIPGRWTAAHIAEWHRILEERTKSAPSGAMIALPAVSGIIPSGGAPISAEAASPGKGANTNAGPSGPKSYRSTMFQFGVISDAITRIIANAKEADDTERAALGIEAIESWGWQAPVGLFDAGLWDGRIRPGAKIVLVGESAHTRAKGLNGVLPTDGSGLDVVSVDEEGGIKVSVPNRRLPLFLRSGEYRRWLPAPVVTNAGPKFAVGDLVEHASLGQGEVVTIETVTNNVTGIASITAKVFFLDMDSEVDTDVAELTKIA